MSYIINDAASGQMIENGGAFNSILLGSEQSGPWGGLCAADALNLYKELYALGTLSSVHFGVEIKPWDENGLINSQEINLYKVENLTKIGWDPEAQESGAIPLFDDKYKLPWLAHNCDTSNLDAQFDSINVGHHQMNFLTGNASGEISVTFIETKNGAILNSAKAIKEIMFPRDGTQALPKDYLMVMTIYIYDRFNSNTRIFEQKRLVALQADSIPLDASNVNGVMMVPLTFMKMFPMLQLY